MSERFVTIASFHDPVAAALAKNFLEGDGIPALLLDEDTAATLGSLSTAIGGIKLQVPAIHVERAELMLAQIDEERAATDDVEPMPATAIATPEIAEELREDREDRDPINQLVDRLFRSAAFGLVFWPLQLYAILLLLELAGTEGKVSPQRRWKIWVSMLLNVPLWAVVVVPLLCLTGNLEWR